MNNNKWGLKWLPRINKNASPLYLQIADAIDEDIKKGVLKSGDKLPPVRPLSYHLECNTGTIYKAYIEAEKRGLVKGETGRGTFVRGLLKKQDITWPNENPESRIIDFSDNFPSNIDAVNRIISKEIENTANFPYLSDILQYQYNSANQIHLDAAVNWLNKSGMEVHKENVLITNGALNGGFISLLTITEPGDLILTEELTSQAVKGIAVKLQIRLKGIPMDKDGIIPERLEDILKKSKVKAVYLTPNIQNPTTIIMPLDRRKAIARLAKKYNFYIIEDDVFGAFIPNALPPISSLIPKKSFYTTSFSKIISPALRIGYLKVPDDMYQKTLNSLRTTIWMASPINAHITSNIINNKQIKDIIDFRRKDVIKRQEIANEILGEIDILANKYSMHIWLKLPEPIRANQFVSFLRSKEIAITPTEDFAVDRGNTIHGVRICLCSINDIKLLREGLEKIRYFILEKDNLSSGISH